MDPALDSYMLSFTAENEGQKLSNYDENQVEGLIPSSFQGNLSPPEFINHQKNGLHNGPRRSLKSPKNQLGLEGQLDLSRPDSINQQSIQVPKPPRIRPRHNLSLEGDLDLSRPDSINQQRTVGKNGKKVPFTGPSDNFGLEGHLDLTRPHSINQQIHPIQRSPKMKPQDHLGPLEGLNISWPSSPSILEKVKKGQAMVKPKDNFSLEGQMEISRKEWGRFNGQHFLQRPSSPQDTLSLEGSLDFTTKDQLQR